MTMNRILCIVLVALLHAPMQAGVKLGTAGVTKAINQSEHTLKINWYENGISGYEASIGPKTSPLLPGGGTFIQWCQPAGGNVLKITVGGRWVELCDAGELPGPGRKAKIMIKGDKDMVLGATSWNRQADGSMYWMLDDRRNDDNLILKRNVNYHLYVTPNGYIYFLGEGMMRDLYEPKKLGYPTENENIGWPF